LRRGILIEICGKFFKEIVITDNDDNLLAMITDDGEIVEYDGIRVKCTPDN
jgi:hypothetical protein